MNTSQWISLLTTVQAGRHLNRDEAAAAVDLIMRGEVPPAELATFLLALRTNGETVDETAGAAAALRLHMRRIHCRHTRFVDTCGTGGDGARTFNISTAAAIVTAAAGMPVAKHGNRSVTSKSGSSDVLTALGVNIQTELSTVESCLDRLGIGFCFAPLYHPAMKQVAEVRRALGVPTIFNLLGPLANPAGAPCQLLGVGRPVLRPLLAGALQKLGTTRSAVVSGDDGLDEVTLADATHVSLVTPEGIKELVWTPEDFGLQRAPLDELLIEGPEASARLIREILDGKTGPARDIVLLNSAAALWVTEAETDLRTATVRAARAIDDGAAGRLLDNLIRATNS